MARFIFPLEQLLNIKRKLEKQEQMALARCMQKLSASMQKLQIAQYQQQDANKEFQEHMSSGRIIQTEIKRLNEKVKYFYQEVKNQQIIVKRNEQEVDKAKEKVREALRERKTYEILREKAFENYLEEEKLADAKVVDEIISYKYRE